MDLKDFLSDTLRDSRMAQDIVHCEVLAGRCARFGRIDPPLPGPLQQALIAHGAGSLYLHQAEGIHRARQGLHVVTVTPTASGKTLGYTLPILERILYEPDTRALLLFPLKALAQDQLKRLRDLAACLGLPQSAVAIYDGDTTPYFRTRIRKNPPNLLLTNPDMLHQGILPFHANWENLFRYLRFVVIDELHAYKGVFGSHVLQILRRLRRVALFYQARPQFLATSATIANPRELAEQLTGLPFDLVEENGAPSSGRRIFLVNPTARSLYTVATHLFTEAVKAGQKTILFTKARKITELIHRWTLLSNPDLSGKISAYRSGYLPAERREIEHKLQSGILDGVISTSALEMGIDIGGLDICILVGYPGTITATWQRAGRVGRLARESAIFLIAQPDALDQYFMRYPQDFFQRGAEAGVVDAVNPYLLKSHLVCAAQEVPLRPDDQVYQMDALKAVIRELTGSRELIEAADGAVWFSNRKRPHHEVDIRGAGASYAIMEEESRRLIGRVSGLQALTEAHPGAIYLHAGQMYRVVSLDVGSRDIVAARAGEVGYYTMARTQKETEILEVLDRRENKRFSVSLGRLKVTEWVIGYEKRSVSNRQKISEHTLDLPPVIFETVGLWLQPSALSVAGLTDEKYHLMGSLHAIEHACLALLPLFALCDRTDVGGISFTSHPKTCGAAVFLYDGHPGGVGLSARAYQVLDELFTKVLAMVEGCTCQEGCPSCIHSPKCGNGNTPLDKEGCLRLLQHLTGKKELSGKLVSAGTGGGASASSGPFAADGSLAAPAPTTGLAGRAGEGEKAGISGGPDSSGTAGPLAPYQSRLHLAEGRDVIVFDLETQLSAQEVGGWHNAHLMRLSVGVVYERSTGRYQTYREDRVKDLLQRMAVAELVVGFNQKCFDYAVLKAYTGRNLGNLPSIDLLEEIYRRYGFRLSLEAIVSATFGTSKCGNGLAALRWWKEGKIEEIERYCRMDVELTARLFDHILDHGYLLYENKNHGRVRLPLELALD
ncbi:MAG: DEAD/DEAH box helicase [bacterium]